ncbi:MAG: hypothetical protein Q9187_001905 [Circinaria calcarea]
MKRLFHLPRTRYQETVEADQSTTDKRIADVLPKAQPSLAPFQPILTPLSKPPSDTPVVANFDSSHLTIGAGVAIFHLATSRVVICRHSVKKLWFLPKGRRDASEETGAGAEREGYEESGYRNRLLPVRLLHRQPQAYNASVDKVSPFVTEPIWTQMVPQTRTSQYILFWYIAETVPPQVEEDLNAAMSEKTTAENPTPYQTPPKFPLDMTLAERVMLEQDCYTPQHHKNTAIDADEALYESYLLPVEEAMGRLKGTVMEDVVRSGWEAICSRHSMEAQVSTGNWSGI